MIFLIPNFLENSPKGGPRLSKMVGSEVRKFTLHKTYALNDIPNPKFPGKFSQESPNSLQNGRVGGNEIDF